MFFVQLNYTKVQEAVLFLSTASPYCVRLSKHFELGSLRYNGDEQNKLKSSEASAENIQAWQGELLRSLPADFYAQTGKDVADDRKISC